MRVGEGRAGHSRMWLGWGRDSRETAVPLETRTSIWAWGNVFLRARRGGRRRRVSPR